MKTTPPHFTPISRRRFVGHLTLGATALALGSRSFGQAAAPKKLGMAIVGLGGYAGGQLAPALKLTQHVELRGVITGSRTKGQQWAPPAQPVPSTSEVDYSRPAEPFPVEIWESPWHKR